MRGYNYNFPKRMKSPNLQKNKLIYWAPSNFKASVQRNTVPK
jgi:hypothetical protein